MTRHPWRIRTLLTTVVAGLAGAGVTLSLTTGQVDTLAAAAAVVLAVLAELGIIRDGEAETTPVADPVGPDGLPMVTWVQAEQMAAGIAGAAAGARSARPSDEEIARMFGDRDHG